MIRRQDELNAALDLAKNERQVPRPPTGRAYWRTMAAEKLVQTETRRVRAGAAARGMNNMSGRKSRSRRRSKHVVRCG